MEGAALREYSREEIRELLDQLAQEKQKFWQEYMARGKARGEELNPVPSRSELSPLPPGLEGVKVHWEMWHPAETAKRQPAEPTPLSEQVAPEAPPRRSRRAGSVLVVANHKGGIGKTTTAVTLATGLADIGREVLLVDTDPQGNVAAFLGLEPAGGLFDLVVARRPLDKVATPVPGFPTLRVILGDESTADINTLLTSGSRRLQTRTAMADALAPARHSSDVIILDTAPSLSAIQVSALAASDWLIIPASPEFASEAGIAQLAGAVTELQEQGCNIRLLGILPTLVLTISTEHRQTRADLEAAFPGLVLPAVRRLIALAEAPRAGKPIWTYAPRSEAAQDYAAVLGEVIRRGGF